MDKGWIKLHRQLFENHFLFKDKTAYWVFTRLLMIVGSNKGEWSGGIRQLGKLMDLDHNTLYKVLKRLEEQEMIQRTSKHKYSIISICNWHKYQSTEQTLQQTHGKHTVNVREHSNKKKNKKKKYIHSDFEYLEPELSEFVKMRKLIKRPMTDIAIQRLITKVNILYPNQPEKQKACLLQSVDHNWQTVYELKQEESYAAQSRFF